MPYYISELKNYISPIIKCIIVCLTLQSLEMQVATFLLLTTSLFKAMRQTDYAAPFILQRSAVIDAFRSWIVSLFRRAVAPLAIRCCTVLLLLQLFLFYRGHPYFRNSNLYLWIVDSFLDRTCVSLKIAINKLDLVLNRIVAGRCQRNNEIFFIWKNKIHQTSITFIAIPFLTRLVVKNVFHQWLAPSVQQWIKIYYISDCSLH